MKTFFGIVGAIALFLVGIFSLNYFGYANFAFFAPRYEEVRRQTFEESRAFNEGMVRDFQNLKMQYETADENGKRGLRAVILHRFSVYPEERMPPDLRVFYGQVKRGG